MKPATHSPPHSPVPETIGHRISALSILLLWSIAISFSGSDLAAAEPVQPTAVATEADAPRPDPWRKLFDGKTLDGWKVTDFAGAGEVEVLDGSIFLGMGAMLTGIVHTNPLPNIDYEVTLKAMRIDGSDFFCGLTFPVKDAFCTLIAGGWGGGLVGLSSLDTYDASENETTTFRSFEKNRWYNFRLRVTQARIEAWLDEDPLIDVSIVDRKVSLRPGDIEMSVPFGISAWQTRAALRDIRLRPLDPSEIPPSPALKP
jgi:hypothetical protein